MEKSRVNPSAGFSRGFDHYVDDDVRPAHEGFAYQSHLGIVEDPLSLIVVGKDAGMEFSFMVRVFVSVNQ